MKIGPLFALEPDGDEVTDLSLAVTANTPQSGYFTIEPFVGFMGPGGGLCGEKRVDSPSSSLEVECIRSWLMRPAVTPSELQPARTKLNPSVVQPKGDRLTLLTLTDSKR